MSAADRRFILLFSEAFGYKPDELGGKGYSLSLMTRLGMPVPPGLIISVEMCKLLVANHHFSPNKFRVALNNALRKLEIATGSKLGDYKNPLFLAARSGAPVSMPGMMDSIFNLGLNQETIPSLARVVGEQFAKEVYRSFNGKFPFDDLEEQVSKAIRHVAYSWGTRRAKAYRQVHAIPDEIGTAVILQKMVFGNSGKRSGTGIVFSRDVKTGEPRLFGEYLPNAQGERLVSGSQTPKPLEFIQKKEPKIYQQLGKFSHELERHFQDAVEVEFTIESGKLWLLQARSAKCAPAATARIMVDLVKEKILKEWEVLEKIDSLTLAALKHPKMGVNPKVWKTAVRKSFFAQGIPAASGFATGKAVFTSEAADKHVKKGEAVILLRPETNAEDISGIVAASAIVTAKGGQTCHAAVVARSLGKPAVVGAKGLHLSITGDTCRGKDGREIKEGDFISVNGNSGVVVLGKIDLQENGKDDYVEKILKWEKRYPQKPRINFRLVNNQFNVNRILADFYVTERLARDLINTPLAQEAEILRSRTQSSAAQIFSLYLLLAIAGEARHTSDRTKNTPAKAVLTAKLFSFGVGTYKDYRSEIQRKVVAKLKNTRASRVLKFVKLCHQAFSELDWDGSMGGKSWAKIAEALELYLAGRWGVTTFVDRIFNLEHNGGLAFDKHPMVSDETTEPFLYAQLNAKRDVQTLRDLYRGVTKYREDETKLSPEVEDLYRRAIKVAGRKNDH